MKNSFYIISLARILGVEKLNPASNKGLIDVPLGNLTIDFCTNNKSQEELVNYLQVRPHNFHGRLVFFGIKVVCLWGQGSKQINLNHLYYIRHERLGEYLLARRSIDIFC